MVTENDAARRSGDVLSLAERVPGPALDDALSGRDVLEKVGETRHQVCPTGLDRATDDLGIGHREVARRDRVEILVDQEIDRRAALGVHVVGEAGHRAELVGGNQIRIAD